MVEMFIVFCYCLCWIDAYRQYMYVYGTCLVYVCCSDCVGVCGNVSCVAYIDRNSVLKSCNV